MELFIKRYTGAVGEPFNYALIFKWDDSLKLIYEMTTYTVARNELIRHKRMALSPVYCERLKEDVIRLNKMASWADGQKTKHKNVLW